MLTLKGRAVRDPRFLKVMGRLQHSALRTRHHPPPSEKAAQAQAAAVGPANEKIAGAKANQAGAMQQAQTGKPDNNSFLALLRAEIQKIIPKQVEGTKNFLKGQDKQQLKGAMTGNIAQQKQAATGDLNAAATAPLNTEAVPGKPVTPLPSEPAPAAPPSVGAADALPAPKSDNDVSLQGGQQEADRALTDNQLTTPQLAEANDPRFSRVITAKAQVDTATPAMPAKYRLDEQRITTGAAAKAVADEKKGLSAFQAQKGKNVADVRQRQLTAKEKDELERKRVTDTIEGIFNRTKTAVDTKLASLDEEVAQLFDRGTDAALARMRDYIESRFDDRYTGIRGKARWVRDKFLDLPDSVKQWFVEARQVFLQDLDLLVVLVATLMERRLQQAKEIISRGQQEIADYVNGLPANLQNVGRAAEKEMAGRFDDLRAAVEDKKGDLAGKLAMRYKEAMDKGDAALKEIRDAHKSLVQRVKEFVGEVVEVLRNFKNRIMSMLRKAASVIGLIVSSPIRFLKNLLSAIKQGIAQFRDRIWEHLQRAFLEWLFGNLKDSGVTMPKDLSLPSIFMLVLQVLGLTYDRLRAKAVRLVGERNVALVEQVGELLRRLWMGGPVALWESFKEHLSDLRARVVDELQSWVITTVIKAAVTKLAMMFNPVGAIIQAILTIYKVVTFLIERINQILEFVGAIFDSVAEIATGAIGAAANCIERALAKALVLMIAFLAHFLGLSGVADRVRSIIKKLQGAVDRAVDKVIEKVVGGVGKLIGAGKAAAASAVQWWKQRKPFKTDSGTAHEIYYAGDEKNPVPMVASRNPKPIAAKLDEFDKQASKADASKSEKDGKSRVSTARAAAKKDPGDPNLVVHLKELFQTYDEGSGKETKITRKTGSLAGTTVGLEMKADWLGGKIPEGTKPEAGAQEALMDLLVTDPNQRSPFKYIRGHLLNEHLGGRGNAENMFPITGNANSQHLHSTETTVKSWVKKKKRWVLYEVKVLGISLVLDPKRKKSADNQVNATFACHAVLKDAAGKTEDEFSTSVRSTFEKKEVATET